MLAHSIKRLAVLAGFTAAFGVAALGGNIVGGSALATAAGGSNVIVSPPGVVDSDGTQGSYAPAMQGQQDSDGDQDAYANNSWEATPQGTHPK